MKYAILFFVLAASLLGLAILQGGYFFLTLWPALSMVLLALGYAKLGARVLGKQADGTMAVWAIILFAPYLLSAWTIWRLMTTWRREDCCNEITPGLWLGRRLLVHEIPPGIDLVIDLTAEFKEPHGIVAGRTYVSLPILDASVPDPRSFECAVAKAASWPGTVFVHCASGHGRSALVVAAVLLRRGAAMSVNDAIEKIKRARPAIGLNKQQRTLLESWFRQQGMQPT